MNKYNNFHIRPQSVNRLRSIPLITDRHVSDQNRSYTPSKDHILSTPIQINQTTRNNPNLSLGTPHQSKSDISLNYPASHYNSNISLLTLQANEQLKIKERRVCLPPADLYRSSSQINSKRMPGPHEFSKILDKLEKVATNQMGSLRKPALKEAKSVLILMEQGESQYFKIKVKGKNCPLRVNIKKNRGNYRVYASKTVPEPNETLNDYIFKTDYLNIGDIGLNFKFDCIYLGILAIENSSLEISVFFGKLGQEIDQNDRLSKSPASNIFRDNRSKSSRKLEELMRNDTLREKLRRKAEEILNQRKAQAILLSGHKDFLKLNMALNTPTSPTGQRPSSTTREKREQRRTEVKVRKEHIFSERKIRLITLNHRHEARKLEIEEEMKAKKLKKSIDKCYIYWIRIIYFSKGYTSIVQNLKTTREEIIRKIYRIAMARKMQRFCRKAMSQITIQKLKFLRARNCLLFYYSNYRPIVTMTDSVRIFKFIRDSAKNYVIPKQFTGLQHKIITLQISWRFYQKQNKKRWEILISMWHQAIEKLLLQNRGVDKKKSRKKKIDPRIYTTISMVIRNQVLFEYYRNCKLSYNRRVKIYLTNNRQLVKKGILTYINQKENIESLFSQLPKFLYIPTWIDLLDMINKAVGHMKQRNNLISK